MEIFLDILVLILQIFMICMIYNVSKIVRSYDNHMEFFCKKFLIELEIFGENIDEIKLKTVKMSGQFDSIQEYNQRSLQDILERLDAAKPITPKNNWDSIKEAFKGPARVEINERN